MLLVMRNTPGLGFGTYLKHLALTDIRKLEFITYQVKSTFNSLARRTRACLMRATPPPCGVLEKKAIFVPLALRDTTNFIIASQVRGPHVFWKSSRVRIRAVKPESTSTIPL